MTSLIWLQGARPRTLPAAVVPVLVGAACAAGEPGATWWRAVVALVVSLALQVGVNFANDYSDGIRGTDSVRVGPMRLVGSGRATPTAVKRAAGIAFGAAALAGAWLAATTSWWLLVVGAAALLAGWFYTGGPHPYGYIGLGEVFVFVFFGLVATIGTTFVVLNKVNTASVVLSVGVGAVACALLVVNNLRDIPTDREAGKRTLAVRIGDARTRVFYLALLVVAVATPLVIAADRPWLLVTLIAVPLAVAPVQKIRGGAHGPDLIAVLAATGKLQLAYGVLIALGLVLSR